MNNQKVRRSFCANIKGLGIKLSSCCNQIFYICAKRTAYLLVLLGFLILNAHAAPELKNHMSFAWETHPSAQPLTNALVSKLEPTELNPAFRRWVLAKLIQLNGVQISEAAPFTIKASGVTANVEQVIRHEGPWYRPLAEFPCTKDYDPRFAMPEGALKAAEAGAQFWQQKLSERMPLLEMRLSRIQAQSKEQLEQMANSIFQDWLNGVQLEWVKTGVKHTQTQEWKYYQYEAVKAGICKRKGKKPVKLPTLESIMEPPPAVPGPLTPLLPIVRAPAKKFGEFYSVHLTLHFGERNLVGRFLINLERPVHLISDEWLYEQGTPVFYLNAARVSGSLDLDMRMGGEKLSFSEFKFAPQASFSPKETLANCCDGVLGRTSFRRFVTQFDPKDPIGIELYDPARYTRGEPWKWFLMETLPNGNWKVSCPKTAPNPKRLDCGYTDKRIAYDPTNGRFWVELK